MTESNVIDFVEFKQQWLADGRVIQDLFTQLYDTQRAYKKCKERFEQANAREQHNQRVKKAYYEKVRS